MTDALTAYSKAFTGLVTFYAMTYLRAHLDLAGMGLEGTMLTVVQTTCDALSGMFVGFMVWLIPIGQKWWHQNILGERVAIVTVDPVSGNVKQIEGTVVTVNSTGAALTDGAKADAIDSEIART